MADAAPHAPAHAPARAAAPAVPAARTALVAAASVLAGILIAIAWSFRFVDDTIGGSVATALLGEGGAESAISGSAAGAAFAFVAGLAGTFTACNVAAFGAVAPLLEERRSVGERLLASSRPLGWLALGMCSVAAVYGAIGALAGTRLPQLSSATVGAGMPVRLLQSTVVFGAIGLALLYLGLAALRIVPDPLARLAARRPGARSLVMGALIGAFLIGRPFPMFRDFFEYAAATHNPFYGALSFVLVAFGNVLLVALLYLLLASLARGGARRSPERLAAFSGVALLAAGSFTFIYWAVRVPAAFGYGWFPTAPWS